MSNRIPGAPGTPGNMAGMRPPQQQVSVNWSLATDVKCDNCGNLTFEEVVLMKHFSDLTSPTGKAGNVPIPTFACVSCGFVNLEFLPLPVRPEAEPSTQSPPETSAPKIDIVR